MAQDAVSPAMLGRLTDVLTLEQVAPGEEDDPSAFAALAVDAVERMAGLLRPLAVEVTFACADRVSTYPRANPTPPRRVLLLVPEDLPDGVEPGSVYTDALRQVVPELDRATVLGAVDGGLDQACPGGDDLMTTWVDLLVTATEVRLPDATTARLGGAGELTLAAGAGTVTAPVAARDGVAWVAGPRPARATQAPVEVAVRNEAGLLTLTVATRWSLWAWDGAGAEDLRAVEAGLRAAGWVGVGEAG